MRADPYRYFRIEARELVEGLTQGVLAIEKGLAEAPLLSQLLRYAHTLKGAARIVKQAKISELSHSMEEVLATIREQPGTVSSEGIRQLLKWIDEISSALAALDVPAPAPVSAAPACPPRQGGFAEAGDEQLQTVRVDIKDLDALLRTTSEFRVQLSGLSRLSLELQQAAHLAGDLAQDQSAHQTRNGRKAPPGSALSQEHLENTLKDLHRAVSAVLDRSQRELDSLCEQAESMRLVPANSIFGALERTARDAAEATGKQIAFEAVGGDTRLDARGLSLLRNAIIHLVRNAVTHGVESPAARAQAGKPPAGSVKVSVERHGDRALFRCRDDGGGVDMERLRQVIVARKLATPAEAVNLTPPVAMDLLLRGGVTTSRTVSELSGRGVGLDVVRHAVAALNGSVAGVTEPGQSTCIEVSVPVVVESQEVLHIQAGESVVSIPLQAVRQTARVRADEIAFSPQGRTIVCQGRAVRYAPLASLLKSGPARENGNVSVLLIESPLGVAALGVDHIVRRERVVIRALPRILGTIPTLSGAFLNSEGTPQVVLNPDGVVETINSFSGLEQKTVKPPPPPLLVIDDSLTTRMLEQGILETAGYEVDTASSGEEALEKVRQRPYGLFIVDVEMPGMDGYQFIQTVRAMPELSSIPSIVVTSRGSPQDRAKGLAVGAKAFVVKGEFDEKWLLKTIRELIG